MEVDFLIINIKYYIENTNISKPKSNSLIMIGPHKILKNINSIIILNLPKNNKIFFVLIPILNLTQKYGHMEGFTMTFTVINYLNIYITQVQN